MKNKFAFVYPVNLSRKKLNLQLQTEVQTFDARAHVQQNSAVSCRLNSYRF
jgi:hypothetical protein